MCQQFDLTKATYISEATEIETGVVQAYYLCDTCHHLVLITAYTPETLPVPVPEDQIALS